MTGPALWAADGDRLDLEFMPRGWNRLHSGLFALYRQQLLLRMEFLSNLDSSLFGHGLWRMHNQGPVRRGTRSEIRHGCAQQILCVLGGFQRKLPGLWDLVMVQACPRPGTGDEQVLLQDFPVQAQPLGQAQKTLPKEQLRES